MFSRLLNKIINIVIWVNTWIFSTNHKILGNKYIGKKKYIYIFFYIWAITSLIIVDIILIINFFNTIYFTKYICIFFLFLVLMKFVYLHKTIKITKNKIINYILNFNYPFVIQRSLLFKFFFCVLYFSNKQENKLMVSNGDNNPGWFEGLQNIVQNMDSNISFALCVGLVFGGTILLVNRLNAYHRGSNNSNNSDNSQSTASQPNVDSQTTSSQLTIQNSQGIAAQANNVNSESNFSPDLFAHPNQINRLRTPEYLPEPANLATATPEEIANIRINANARLANYAWEHASPQGRFFMEEQELVCLEARVRDRIRDSIIRGTEVFTPEDAARILGIPNPDAETLARINLEYFSTPVRRHETLVENFIENRQIYDSNTNQLSTLYRRVTERIIDPDLTLEQVHIITSGGHHNIDDLIFYQNRIITMLNVKLHRLRNMVGNMANQQFALENYQRNQIEAIPHIDLGLNNRLNTEILELQNHIQVLEQASAVRNLSVPIQNRFNNLFDIICSMNQNNNLYNLSGINNFNIINFLYNYIKEMSITDSINIFVIHVIFEILNGIFGTSISIDIANDTESVILEKLNAIINFINNSILNNGSEEDSQLQEVLLNDILQARQQAQEEESEFKESCIETMDNSSVMSESVIVNNENPIVNESSVMSESFIINNENPIVNESSVMSESVIVNNENLVVNNNNNEDEDSKTYPPYGGLFEGTAL